MGIIIAAVILVLVWCFPSFIVVTVTNFGNVIKYSVKDLCKRMKYKSGRIPKTGEIIAYIGLFGMGKTLSAVHHIRAIYRANHGARVFCPRREKWVKQRIRVLSNVEFKDIPYIPLNDLRQVIDSTEPVRTYDDEHDTLTITLVLIDEAGSKLNSREFKKNIDPLVLNSILTCRHWHISIIYTAQRFGHVDALLRQVTSYVYACNKKWRFLVQKKYDAWELEQAQEPGKVSCKSILTWFVRDEDFNAYDTYACVGDLKKDIEEGHMASEDEILALRNYAPANMEVVDKKSKKRKPHYLF